MKGEVSSGVIEMLTCLVYLEKANSKQKQRSLSQKKKLL